VTQLYFFVDENAKRGNAVPIIARLLLARAKLQRRDPPCLLGRCGNAKKVPIDATERRK
jgi:hypothetical protein